MSRSANLSCPRCSGEFENVGSEDNDLLYECQDCGETLREDLTESFSDGDSALARLCEVLLERGGDGQ